MENALLVGLSRQVALRRELDVIANNIANLGTTGFKGEGVRFEQYLDSRARVEHFASPADRPVRFVIDRETRTDFSQGAFSQTGNELDVAIDGPGFLVVETPDGERYTRNGSLAMSAAGELITNDGHRVLGDGGPIVFEPGDSNISIARDGTISTQNGERGRLRVAEFEHTGALVKEGLHLFSSGAAPVPAEPHTRVIQGSIEKANLQPVAEIARMIEVTRAYTTISTLMSRTDELRRTALERLAEVPN